MCACFASLFKFVDVLGDAVALFVEVGHCHSEGNEIVWCHVATVGAKMEIEFVDRDAIVEYCWVFKVFEVDLIDSYMDEFGGSFLGSDEGG